MPEPPTFADILDARRTIAPYVYRTPLRQYESLSELVGADVWVKHENFQLLGSFKVRGGVNLVSRLSEEAIARGVITASTGNHGQSIAFAARAFGAAATVVVPEGANPGKVRAMGHLGARVVFHGEVFEDGREYAERLAAEEGYRFVHPADEPLLIAGVGTYSAEIFEDLGDVDVILVPLGAGSGASGACIAAAAISPSTEVIAVQAEAAPAAYVSWKAGELVDAEMSTAAEGLATRSAYELPQRILREMLTDFVLAGEDEIREAVRLYLEHTHTLVEGAGAVPLAAALKMKDRLKGRRVVLVASGANLSAEHLRQALAGQATAPIPEARRVPRSPRRAS